MTLQEKIQAAEAGDVNAMLAMGEHYLNDEREKDPDKAAVWYEKAAEHGHLTGMINAANLAVKDAMINEMMKDFTEAYQSWVKAAYWAGKAKDVLSSNQAKATFEPQALASLYQNVNNYYQEAVYGAASIAHAIQKDFEKAYNFLNKNDAIPSTRNHLLKGCCLFRMAVRRDERTCGTMLGSAYLELSNMITDGEYLKNKERTTLEEAIFVESVSRLAIIFNNGLPGMLKAEPQKARNLFKICIDYAANQNSKNALIGEYNRICG